MKIGIKLVCVLSLLIIQMQVFAGQTDDKYKLSPEIRSRVMQFNLTDVRLLDGPFKEAMKRNADWLLSLESDRFLAWFRKEAGLEPIVFGTKCI